MFTFPIPFMTEKTCAQKFGRKSSGQQNRTPFSTFNIGCSTPPACFQTHAHFFSTGPPILLKLGKSYHLSVIIRPVITRSLSSHIPSSFEITLTLLIITAGMCNAIRQTSDNVD